MAFCVTPGYHTLVSTSGGTQDVDECDVVGAVRFSTNASISTWETGTSSVSDQGTGILRVNWTTAFQNNFSDYRAAAIQFQFYISDTIQWTWFTNGPLVTSIFKVWIATEIAEINQAAHF